MQPPTLSVVVPAFNEQTTIAESMLRLSNVLDKAEISHEIIVVSDGSTDDTVRVLDGLSIPDLQVVANQVNMGKGAALRTGSQRARGEFLAFQDADLDLHPEALVGLLALLESTQADGAIGSKIHPDSVVHYPLARRVMSSGYRFLIRLAFDLRVSDTQTGVKVFKREKVVSHVQSVETNGFGFDLELLVRMHNAGLHVIEGPIVLDFQFESTIRINAVGTMFRDLVRLRRVLRN
jgi:glycosyltransferase involved in cell wall biosynthesis